MTGHAKNDPPQGYRLTGLGQNAIKGEFVNQVVIFP